MDMRVAACLALLALPAAGENLTAKEIVARSAEADRNNLRKANDYTYTEHREERRAGVTDSRTFDVLILDGSPYRRLVARNGKPLADAEARKVAADFEKARQKRLRESADERRRRLERDDKQRRESRKLLAEIPAAFELTLRGEEQVSGVPVWVIDAEPRPGFKSAVNSDYNMLSKFRGRLWIEKRTYQWVKVEAETLDSIRIGLVLFKLDKGSKLAFEQVFVNGELWLPKRVSAQAAGRIALFKKLNVDQLITYSDYRKFQTDSRILSVW